MHLFWFRQRILPFLSKVCYCNLSPQGDGNTDTSHFSSRSASIAIYPRKGTETFFCAALIIVSTIAIYPRKGTETPFYFHLRALMTIAIYPRKGTETDLFCRLFGILHIAIYPRKGTETSSA